MFETLKRIGVRAQAGRLLLAVDAWLNSSFYEAGQDARRAYSGFSAFMDGFHVGGFRRLCVEAACEGLTLGLGGAVLMLGLALPAFRETSDDDWLKKQDLAVSFLDRYGAEVGRRGIKHDDSVPLEQMPDYLINAAIATEDRRFFDHFGIDPIGVFRALSVNAKSSGVVQGGSSITQQLAKNLFLSNERTVERKVKEAFLALWLEARLPKKQILSLYFDRAYMGGGAFGVQAASDFYFGKNVRDISLAEAAMLAGLFKAPTKFAPHINLPAARARANDVLSNMVDAGYLTEGQVYAARRNPATPVDRKREATPDWYLDFAYEEVRQLSQAGKLGGDRVLTVRTGLDGDIQRRAETAVEDALRQYGHQYRASQGSAVVMEPTGVVRAIVGGRDYGQSQFNRATDAARQPGSSFKPFVYLTAVKTGKFHRETIVNGSSLCIGNWCPHNYHDQGAGSLPMVEALEKSLNTVAVYLSIKIGEFYWPKQQPYHLGRVAELGRAKIVETARAMGVVNTPLPDTVSLPLGADDVKMIDMVAAYGVFANGGKRATPYAAVDIRNSRGEIVYRRDRDGAPAVQVQPADKIAEMNNLLKEVVAHGTARVAQLEGVVAAGKTGTTNASRDAWFDGYTGNYVCSVWFGNDDDSPTNNMTGGTLPARTWHEIMAYAHQGIELKNPYGVVGAPEINMPTATASASGRLGAPQRPATLSRRSSEALGGLDDLFRSAQSKAERAEWGPPRPPVTFAGSGGGDRRNAVE